MTTKIRPNTHSPANKAKASKLENVFNWLILACFSIALIVAISINL